MAVGPQESVLAPRFSRAVAVLVVVICAVTEYSLMTYGHVDVLLRATPAVLLAAFGTYILSWKPLVRVSPSALEIINPLRTSRVGWGAIRDVSTRWTLAVVTDSGTINAWAAPAESPWESAGRFRRDAIGRPSLGAQQASSRSGPSPATAQVVMRQWESHRDNADGAAVTTSWDVPALITLGALVVLTIAGIVWP